MFYFQWVPKPPPLTSTEENGGLMNPFGYVAVTHQKPESLQPVSLFLRKYLNFSPRLAKSWELPQILFQAVLEMASPEDSSPL